MIKRICLGLLLTLAVATSAKAGGIGDYIDELKQDVASTYREGEMHMMIPLWVWHNRLTYDREHIKKYNEEPWGFGLGLSRYAGNDWHGLYAVAFKDSNSYVETMFGYAKLYNKNLDCAGNWTAGYGYTLGLTQRHEYSYIPVPLPLPMASVGYKRVSLNAAYVPGVKNDGNVLFTWMRVDL